MKPAAQCAAGFSAKFTSSMRNTAPFDPRPSALAAWRHATGVLVLDRPRVLGIVNVTPDSFSDGGRLRSLDDARRHIDTLVHEGADVIDIGAESTRPGATPVAIDEEMRRLVPIVVAAVESHPGVPVSIDTVKSNIARE